VKSKIDALKKGFISGLEGIIAELTSDYKTLSKIKEVESRYVGSRLEKYYNFGDLLGNVSLLAYLLVVPYLTLIEQHYSLLGAPFLIYLAYRYIKNRR